MSKNYIIGVFAFLSLFLFQLGQAQNNLEDNEFGLLIKTWLNQNKDKYELSESDISNLLVSDSYFSKKTRINHVYVNQAYQGVKIHNAISSVAVRDNFVFYYANGLIQDISSKVNTVTPVINAEAAINVAVNEYNLGSVSNLSTISNTNNNYVFSNGNVSKYDIPVSLVFQHTEDGSLKLAWDLSIRSLIGQNWYSVRVDAVNGQILDTNDFILSCDFGDGNHTNHNSHNTSKIETIDLFKPSPSSSMLVDGSSYNVFAIPNESPSDGSREIVTEPADLVASPFGWHDTDGIAGAEFTTSRGNNVYALDDLLGTNLDLGISSEGTASLTFNDPLDFNQEPIGYLNASLTNLFYVNNIMHDIWYQYGFDEVSGNFQDNNYGNGGLGSDFIFAECQDGQGLNNAFFGTAGDGAASGMTMFLWNAVGPPGSPLTINTSSIAGDYSGLYATFGQPVTTPVTANLVLLVDDDAGVSTDPNDACDSILNSGALSGNIAVLRRGECEFGSKVLAAESAGAIGVIVINNALTDVIVMGPGAEGALVTIPSIMISLTDGQAILTALNNGETINGSLVPAGPFQRDGSFDNVIVAHEYGHGISIRLTGGPSTAGCLGNDEDMGEGWSDWFGLMITMEATDLPETARGIATYSISQPIDGGGIRPFPYSNDFTVNPLTYIDTNDVANISEPHGIGTIWSTILWDLTWDYIAKYGFDSDFYNGTGGNNKIMQLVLDGLKLQACDPGFVQGRDALLAADNALTGGEDQCMIWEAFAARGVGLNAAQGSAGSRTDQIEDFSMPPATDPSLQNCTSLSVDEFNEASYSIFPNPTKDVLNIQVKKSFGKVTMTLTDINGRVVLTQDANLSSDTQLNISTLQSGVYILTIKGENINTNDKIIKN
ncbi:T9SS-dependent M36 family metallopeptidase [Lacinutrix sp.]|uniref:T9SS-dependent M36 family metallopeptidase n=1 Tax=Lacinutrix sp. TaxID=1937692 RepID=UPI0025C314E3|nr:T9SS-dependent M36 family metallopeptidase [Lacinutrix sp.]